MNLCEFLGHWGGRREMAKALNLSYSTFRKYLKQPEKIPPYKCLEIEKITEGAVTCQELRPDLNWAKHSFDSEYCLKDKPVDD